MSRGRVLTPEERARLLELHAQTNPMLSARSIGLLMAIPKSTVESLFFHLPRREFIRAPNEVSWPQARKDRLRALWDQTNPVISAAAIGELMGSSKNAIVGKVHRMNLVPRPSPICAMGTVRSTDRINTRRQSQRKLERERPALPPPPDRGFVAVAPRPVAAIVAPPAPPIAAPIVKTWKPTVRACEWPMWPHNARPTHKYCGDPAVNHGLCEKHHRLAHPRPAASQAA